MPQIDIDFTGGTTPLKLTVATSADPAVKSFKKSSGRSKADQLRDHLWHGDWSGKDTCAIVWDAANNRWLIWES
jgi:hypothetical protein